jgi:phosphoribosylcarboxyaminoimidazole (NCAIR) mutase
MTLPTIKTSTGATTHCKYNWQQSVEVIGATFDLAASFTSTYDANKQLTFSAHTAGSKPWGRHQVKQVAKNLQDREVLTYTKAVWISSNECETITKYTQTDEALQYYMVGTAAPTAYTLPSLTSTDTVNCVTYPVVTIPTALSAFATFDSATKVITYAKVDDIAMFGNHVINVAWTTAGQATAISNKDKKVVVSKTACDPATMTIGATQ